MLEKTRIREREQDRIFEKRLLKEREEEDRLYGDKEKFVTASYKRKLMENKKWEAEDRRLEEMEKREDVRRKNGLHDFYSSLLTKNTAMGGDIKHAQSAYTAGTKRTDDEGRIHLEGERERKRAKLEEDAARQKVTEAAAQKQTEREEMERAKQEIKVQREKQSQAALEQQRAEAKAEKKDAAQAASKAKQDKLATIAAAKARFAKRKQQALNRPAPAPEVDGLPGGGMA